GFRRTRFLRSGNGRRSRPGPWRRGQARPPILLSPRRIGTYRRRKVMRPRILIAGVGNIFHGDDAFGSEVARLLRESPLSPQARVLDFGIRGHDLAFALQDNYEAVILVDVAQRRRLPGTLSIIELDSGAWHDETLTCGVETHAVHPMQILRFLQAQGSK